MSEPTKAVFLSYASQDAEAAKKICEALRQAGVEVWFDQSELVGGDAWDQKIRQQIKDCALLIPIISAATQARTEGYFRLEWRLADQRTHLMAKGRPFLLPVVIDDTNDADAQVPDSFTDVQWTRLRPLGSAGQARQEDEDPVLAKFVARVKGLLEADPAARRKEPRFKGQWSASPLPEPAARPAGGKRWVAPVLGGLVVAVVALLVARPWREPPPATNPAATDAAPLSEARQLVAKAWVLLNKPEMARAELDAADALCKRAAALDPTDAEVWAAWTHVNVWYFFHNLDNSTQRQEAAREYAARALQLAPQSYEARLAQAFYGVRGDPAGRGLEETHRLLRELLQQRPDEPRALFTLGFSLIWPPETRDEGIELLERLAKNPGFAAVAWDEIGWNRYFRGEYAKAEDAVARSLAAQPYWNNLGLKITLAERVHGDMDLAEATLKQMPASALQEDWGIAFACEVYQWRREPLRTIGVLESLSRDWIHYFFNDYPKAYLLGEARLMAKQSSAAQRDFQRAQVLIEKQLADDPNNVYLLGLQARTLLYLGKKEEAEKSYRLVKELGDAGSLPVHFEPPDVAIAAIRSMVETPSGRGRVARMYFSPASLRLDPQFDRLRPEPAFQALVAELEAASKPVASRSPASGLPSPSHPPEADAKSVAVLAFANLSDDKSNEYFSDGISEELLNVLAKVPGLKVTARTSSFHFKGKDTPVPEIARQLGVAYVVEGSVRKSGDKVRITAQLVKAADGFQVWSDNFDRELKDVFAVQDEIAGLIAKQLSLKLSPGSAANLAAVNPQAFELYLQGRQAWNLRSIEGYARAEQLLNRAIELSPGFSRAQSALADVAMMRDEDAGKLGAFGQRNSPEFADIIAQLQRVLALEPDLAEAHASLGNAYTLGWNFVEGERSFRRAIALNPNYASAHQWLAFPLFFAGRMDEALAEQKRAAELDPLSPRILDNLGHGLRRAGRYREAKAAFDRALSLQPNWPEALGGKALACVALGRADEAIALARLLPAGNPVTAGFQISIFGQAGLRAEANAQLARWTPAGNWSRVQLLLAVGRQEEALAALDASEERLYPEHSDVLLDPLFDPIRDDPRFVKFIATLGWTEAHARAQAWRAAHPPEKPEAAK